MFRAPSTVDLRRLALLAVCIPLTLAGCKQNQVAAPGKTPANATAPALAQTGAKSAQAPAAAATPEQATHNAAQQAKEQQLIRQDSRKCRRHKGLAEPNNVGEQNTSAFLHMMCRDLYCLFLELEELVAEVFGNAVANDAISRFLGEMVGHLDIDVVWRDWLWASPALVENVGNLSRDV